MKTVTVLRVEHTCDHPHGPAAGGCWGSAKVPEYGTVGPTPSEDGIWISSHERCGTLPEQFDAWWYDEERDLGDFVIGIYEVPEKAARIGGWQVVFDIAEATRVGETTDPKQFIPVRSKNLPAPGECSGWGGWRAWAPSEPTDADLAEIEDAADYYAEIIAEAVALAATLPVYTFTPKRATTALTS